jgi:hypothetical protein
MRVTKLRAIALAGWINEEQEGLIIRPELRTNSDILAAATRADKCRLKTGARRGSE